MWAKASRSERGRRAAEPSDRDVGPGPRRTREAETWVPRELQCVYAVAGVR